MLNSQAHRGSTVQVRTPTGKEWALESWSGDMWGDPDDAGDTEPINSDESSWPGEAAFLRQLSEGINPTLPEETPMTSPETVTLQDNVYSPQDQPLPFLFVSKLINYYQVSAG